MTFHPCQLLAEYANLSRRKTAAVFRRRHGGLESAMVTTCAFLHQTLPVNVPALQFESWPAEGYET